MNALNTNELNPTQLTILKGLMSDINDCQESIMDLEDALVNVKMELQEAETLWNEYTEDEGLALLQFNFDKVEGLKTPDLNECDDLYVPQTKRDIVEEFIKYQQTQFADFMNKMNKIDERERRIETAMNSLK